MRACPSLHTLHTQKQRKRTHPSSALQAIAPHAGSCDQFRFQARRRGLERRCGICSGASNSRAGAAAEQRAADAALLACCWPAHWQPLHCSSGGRSTGGARRGRRDSPASPCPNACALPVVRLTQARRQRSHEPSATSERRLRAGRAGTHTVRAWTGTGTVCRSQLLRCVRGVRGQWQPLQCSDAGSSRLPAGALRTGRGSPAPPTCPSAVRLARRRTGSHGKGPIQSSLSELASSEGSERKPAGTTRAVRNAPVR